MYQYSHQMTPYKAQTSQSIESLCTQIISENAAIAASIHPINKKKLSYLLRIANSYYSNLIEGNPTQPIDIEKAYIQKSYLKDQISRNMQEEAEAYVKIQSHFQEIKKTETRKTSDILLQMHLNFYQHLSEKPSFNFGQFRNKNVQVGRHVAANFESIPELMKTFDKIYQLNSTVIENLITTASAHHRLTWIHPFIDGNGRVSRLFSDYYLSIILPGSHGLWSLSRGLSRNKLDYLKYLANADSTRFNDLDGRGNLSQKGLDAFCSFFLEVCLDQVQFMSQLFNFKKLFPRIEAYIFSRAHSNEQQKIKSEAYFLIKELFIHGEIKRGDALRILGIPERSGRRIIKQLIAEALIESSSPKGPLQLKLNVNNAMLWFPGLYT